jgi:hypothetical protein
MTSAANCAGLELLLRTQLADEDEFMVLDGERPPQGWAEHGVAGRTPGPVLLVPIDRRRPAATSLVKHTNGTSAAEALARTAAGLMLRAGAGRLLLRRRVAMRRTAPRSEAPSLHEWLAETYELADVDVAISFGPVRPNQKPTLRVVTVDGATAGFAKCAWNAVTEDLVEHEAGFLGSPALRSLAEVAAPSLVRLGDRAQRRLAAYRPLEGTTWRRRPPPSAAFGEVAELEPLLRSSFGGSVYARRLASRIEQLPAPARTRAAQRYATVVERAGDVALVYGRWHGDWTPWNMGWTGNRLVLWDWERTAAPVPIGFDALHYMFQPRFLRGAHPSAGQLELALDDAGPHLDWLGVPPHARPVLAAAYLLELYVRFGASPAKGPGPLGGLLDRVFATLSDAIDRLR